MRNSAVERKDSKCVIHIKEKSLTMSRRQLLCPLVVISQRFNELYPKMAMSHMTFKKIYGLINNKKGQKRLFRKKVAGKKSDIVYTVAKDLHHQFAFIFIIFFVRQLPTLLFIFGYVQAISTSPPQNIRS